MTNSFDEDSLVDITHCVSNDDRGVSKDLYNRRDEEQATLLEEELVSYGDNDIRSESGDMSKGISTRRKFILAGVMVAISVMILIVLLSVLIPKSSNATLSEIQQSVNTPIADEINGTFIITNTSLTSAANGTSPLNETETKNFEGIIDLSSPTINTNNSEWWEEDEDEEEESSNNAWWQEKKEEQEQEQEQEQETDKKENYDHDQLLNDIGGTMIVDIDTIASTYENANIGSQIVPITSASDVKDTGVIIVDIDTITSSYEAVNDALISNEPSPNSTSTQNESPSQHATTNTTHPDEINDADESYNIDVDVDTNSPTREPTKIPMETPTTIPTNISTKTPSKQPIDQSPKTPSPTQRPSKKSLEQPANTDTNSDATTAISYSDPGYHLFPTFSPTTWLPTATHPPTDFYPWEHGIAFEAPTVPTVSPVPSTSPRPTMQPWPTFGPTTTMAPWPTFGPTTTIAPWPTFSPTTWLPTTTYTPTILLPWMKNIKGRGGSGR